MSNFIILAFVNAKIVQADFQATLQTDKLRAASDKFPGQTREPVLTPGGRSEAQGRD
jgi:hypothetical protein